MDSYFSHIKQNGLAMTRDKVLKKEIEAQIQTLRQTKLAKLNAKFDETTGLVKTVIQNSSDTIMARNSDLQEVMKANSISAQERAIAAREST